jgi:hypothetical protein
MNNPGPIALRAASDAELPATLSVREEGGNNRGKWIEMYLKAVGILVPAPWCMAFVVLRLVRAAATLGLALPKDFPKSGYTPTVANWARKAGKWISAADARRNPDLVKRGDLAFFYFKSLGRIGHVGIVVRVGKTGVWTIEGNTKPDAGVSRESGGGDGVYRKFRSWSELGAEDRAGFARLDF